MGQNTNACLPKPSDWAHRDLTDPEVSEPSCDSQEDNPAQDPLEHLQWARSLPTPCPVHQRPLTDVQIGNLRDMAQNPTEYQKKVVDKLRHWTTRKHQLQEANAQFKQTLDTVQKATLANIDVMLLQELVDTTNHVDTNYVDDLKRGFPVTGSISDGNCGEQIQGGQRVNARPGLGGPKPIDQLKEQCRARNMQTLQMAEARLNNQQDHELQLKTWEKFMQDVNKGVASPPVDIDAINLDENLLVDSFGVWERHANERWKVRVINNFKANQVNDFAWIPSKIHYNSFAEVLQAASILKEEFTGSLMLGKADFRSAFKTLPTQEEQRWLNWGLVFNPQVQKLQVTRLQSHTFGSLGAVMAWYRTAQLIQHVLSSEFGVSTFVYVDDCYWVTRSHESQGGPDAKWQLGVFEYVVTHLLGWQLDPDKSSVGQKVTLLGLDVDLGHERSSWTLNSGKAADWVLDIQRYIQDDRLTPGEASKLCGKLAFLNTHLYGRVARALIRPLIWRQTQTSGPYNITHRIRSSLEWFLRALKDQWNREIPYIQDQFESMAIAYSDAESRGYIASVIVQRGVVVYAHASIPNSIRRKLKPRATNIIAYELVAAIMTIFLLDQVVGERVAVRHFIDSQPARNCLVKGASKQVDLNNMVGLTWYVAGKRTQSYWSHWVASAANLADKPSRKNFQVLKELKGKEVQYDFQTLLAVSETWNLQPHKTALVAK